MDWWGYFHKYFESLLQVNVLPWLLPCPYQIGTVQTVVKVLSFQHQCYLLVTIGTHIFTTILQNNLEAMSTLEVLIGSINALQLLGVSIRHNTESKKRVEDYHNLSLWMSLYTCVVTGGASLGTENADLASTSWSCFPSHL